MDARNALRFALITSGKYDLLSRTLSIRGRDQYGMEVEEQIPATDTARLERDVDAILAGEMPSPIQHAGGVGVVEIKLPPLP